MGAQADRERRPDMTCGELAKLIDDAVATRPEAVGDILSALGCAIERTASHVEEAWQDKRLARVWVAIGEAVNRANETFHRNAPKLGLKKGD